MTRAMKRAFAFAMVASFTLGACGGDKKAAEPAGDPAAVAEAKEVWDTRCTTCHGADGSGNGPGAAALNPKPRSFKDPKWHMTANNDKIKKVIVEGGGAVGLSATMTPNPDLKDKAAVLDELVKKIRSFKP